LGVQIVKHRQAARLSQTKLAATADLSAPKISVLEITTRNPTVATLIKIANALDSRLEIKLVPRKKTAHSRRRRPRAA